MKKQKVENALTITSEQGKALVTEAIASFREQQSAKAIQQVRFLLERIDVMQKIIDKSTRRKELCQKQLQAVIEGKFTIKIDGIGGQPFFYYHDESLNVSWDSTERW